MSTLHAPVRPLDEPVRPVEPQAEWRSADVADPAAWTVRLHDVHVAELDAALAVARSYTDDLLEVGRGNFPLPTLGPVLTGVADELINGRGFVRITGVPVERVGYEDASWMYWGMGRHLGEPWAQNAKGHVLGDVRDQGKAPGDPTSRGNEIGGAALPFHSDGSDLVGLLCLHPGVSGGESRVANLVTAHNELVRRDPELAAVLYEPLPYDYRGEQGRGGRPWYERPVFTVRGDRLFGRYIRPYIQASQRHPEAPRLTARQIEAMDALDEFVFDPDLRVEMLLEPGDIQLINNYHVLHGRRAYADDADTGRVRFLKRLWLETTVLTTDDRPELFRPDPRSPWAAKRTRA